jgi:hypothetical protein
MGVSRGRVVIFSRRIALTLALTLGLALPLSCLSAEIPAAYVAIARSAQVPADVLYAIACAESGRAMPDGVMRPWPWALNVDGQSHFYRSRTDAHQGLIDALKTTQRVDIGLGQVNWYWHRDRFRDPWQALDPYFNLRVAANYLREQYTRCGCDDWWRAVERYHAPSDAQRVVQRRSRYRARVEQCWQSTP